MKTHEFIILVSGLILLVLIVGINIGDRVSRQQVCSYKVIK